MINLTNVAEVTRILKESTSREPISLFRQEGGDIVIQGEINSTLQNLLDFALLLDSKTLVKNFVDNQLVTHSLGLQIFSPLDKNTGYNKLVYKLALSKEHDVINKIISLIKDKNKELEGNTKCPDSDK